MPPIVGAGVRAIGSVVSRPSRVLGPRTLVRLGDLDDSGRMADKEIGVILDVTPGDHEGFERHLLEGMGHEVTVCHGPDGHDCPLIETGACELVDAAHGVVFKLDLDREYHRQILDTYKRLLPADMPIAASVRPGQERTYAELLVGLYVWSHTPTAAELDGFAALVEAADATRLPADPGG